MNRNRNRNPFILSKTGTYGTLQFLDWVQYYNCYFLIFSFPKQSRTTQHIKQASKQERTKENSKLTPSTMSSTATTIIEVQLKKRRPGCTGMFWRPDPTGATKLANNNEWPRDGALLRGTIVEVSNSNANSNANSNGKKWLLTKEIKQKGSSQWVAAPEGAAMPFEYDNHYYLE
jgi:hypothetical protein